MYFGCLHIYFFNILIGYTYPYYVYIVYRLQAPKVAGSALRQSLIYDSGLVPNRRLTVKKNSLKQ
jgi:hypothetical protein